MPLMRAMRPWMNREHEGMVQVGQEFETSEYRASELSRLGLAVYAVSETEKVKVTADPPEIEPEPPVDEPDPPSRQPARRKGR
jgi:hypothetical protein